MNYKIKKSLYLDVAEMLRQRIMDDVYVVDNKLPAEVILADQLGVSRGTLREALSVLEKEGMIYRKHGVGSFVKRKPVEIIKGLESLSFDGDKGAGEGSLSQKLIFKGPLAADKQLSKRLRLSSGQTCQQLHLLASSNDTPIAFHDEIYPDWLMAQKKRSIRRQDFSNPIDFLKAASNLVVGQFVCNMKAGLPPSAIMPYLEIDLSVPILYLEGTVYSQDDQALLYTKQYFRGDQYQFTLVRS